MPAAEAQTLAYPAKARVGPAFAWCMFCGCIVVVLYLKTANFHYFWYNPLFHTYSLLVSFFLLSRFVLSFLYRPPRYATYRSTVSAIIACKNEEQSIYECIECIYQSNYPQEQLEVIAIDDGSTDGTYKEMRRAQAKYPSLQIISFPKNLGKREGMAAAARAASGEILVYVDSDSFVDPDAIRKLVQCFADPSVGASSGQARVKNAETNLLTKMQEVRYYIAFRVNKAAESLFGTVSCCSGCLAAYRRAYVMPILDQWLYQKFLGTQATFGDDRSLTNFMLRRYRVVFSSEALCSTIVPDNHKVFFRQQLRWKKSWIRETLIAMKFMWRRHPAAAFCFYVNAIIPLISPFIVARALVLPVVGYYVPMFSHLTFSTLYLFGCMVMVGLGGFYYLAHLDSKIWRYGFWSFGYSFILIWLTYYAFLTVRRNHWGTR